MAEVRLFPGTLRLTAFTPYKALRESEDGNWVIAGQELGVDSPESSCEMAGGDRARGKVMSSTKRKGAGHIEDNCKAVAIRRCRDLGAELLMDDHSFNWRIVEGRTQSCCSGGTVVNNRGPHPLGSHSDVSKNRCATFHTSRPGSAVA
ncbi:uncharacterized protein FFM5_07921 [Fusarium fujikuroi]|nr:uncharacterized protein FFM5_07921 [Fusarium fujikuroi]